MPNAEKIENTMQTHLINEAELQALSALATEARLQLDYDKVIYEKQGISNLSLSRLLEIKETYVSAVESLICKYKTQGTSIEPAAYGQFLNSDVDQLSLSKGIITSLKSNGFNTVGQLVAHASDVDLLRIPNVGVGKLKHIKTALEAFKAGFKS
jgi:DNA-directed RNA polymerase alpha subunit